MELTQTANITGKVITPLQIDRTLTKEYMCADAKATGDAIRDLDEKVKEVITITGLWADVNITSIKGVCYQNGKVCTVVFDFTTNQEISNQGVPLYADLPRPKDNFVFVAHSMDGTPYWLGVYPTETISQGHISTAYVNNIPSGTRLFGTFTYITE